MKKIKIEDLKIGDNIIYDHPCGNLRYQAIIHGVFKDKVELIKKPVYSNREDWYFGELLFSLNLEVELIKNERISEFCNNYCIMRNLGKCLKTECPLY